MSGTEHYQNPAIGRTGVPVRTEVPARTEVPTRTEVPVQHVEEGTPQHGGPSPSQNILVPVDDHEPARYDTQGFVRELVRGLYPTYTAQQTKTHPDMENTHQYDASRGQQPGGTFLQDTVDRSKSIKPVLRRPVPGPERRDQYVPIQQTEMQSSDENFVRKGEQRGLTPFLSYGLALLFVFLASLGFWIQSRRRPIFFSKEDSRWMVQNPKTMTMLWTSVAAFLAWCTLWLHSCAVSLMARKLIIQGAKISTIECKGPFYLIS